MFIIFLALCLHWESLLPFPRFHSGNKQGEHPEDNQPTRGGSQHAGADQQTVRDPQLPTPGTGYVHFACVLISPEMLNVWLFDSFPWHLSVLRWGHKGSNGVGAQRAVREAVLSLQYDVPANKAGVYHSLSWKHLRLWIQLTRRSLQLRAGLRGRQEETGWVRLMKTLLL